MTKIVWLTDLHLIADNKDTAQSDTALANLRQCLTEVSERHADTARLIVTGDLVHLGHNGAYATLRSELERISIPYRLLVGNHDDRSALLAAFPEIEADTGFIQWAEDLGAMRVIYVDTLAPKGKHTGKLCAARLDWLRAQVASAGNQRLALFLHHPPWCLGVPALDRLRLEEEEALADILEGLQGKVQLFSGHVHRNATGNWRGHGFATLKSLTSQFEADLVSLKLSRSLEPPGYGVILMEKENLVLNYIDLV